MGYELTRSTYKYYGRDNWRSFRKLFLWHFERLNKNQNDWAKYIQRHQN